MGCGDRSQQDVSCSTLSLPAVTPGEFDSWRKTSTGRGEAETKATLQSTLMTPASYTRKQNLREEN